MTQRWFQLCPSLSRQIKLADFGFARHFKDEGHKPIDMTSLAGTPVFMVSLPHSAVIVEFLVMMIMI